MHRDWHEALGSSMVPGSEGMPGEHFYASETESNVVGTCESPGFWLPGFGSPPLTGLGALGDIFSLLVTHFPHLSNGNNKSPHLLSLVSGFRESLAHCLAQSNHLTHGRNNLLFFFFWPLYVAHWIVFTWQGIKPKPSAVKVWSLNHWSARKFQETIIS